jgi:hypothetical protein
MLSKTSFTLVLLLTAIRGFAQDVSIDYDKDFHFSSLRTYSLKSGAPTANPLMDQRIEKAIDNQLSMKGYKRVDSDPDMYVIYYASTGLDINFRSWGSGPPWAYSEFIDMNKVEVGTVVLDIIDASAKKLRFRAVASDTVSDKPEKNEKKINKAAEKAFKKFPPQPGT